MDCFICKKPIKQGDIWEERPRGYKHALCMELSSGKQIPIQPMETIEPLEDIINKPNHYHKGGIDVIGFAEMKFSKAELKGFYRINILKYTTRYDEKGMLEDLKKADFYLKKLIALEEA